VCAVFCSKSFPSSIRVSSSARADQRGRRRPRTCRLTQLGFAARGTTAAGPRLRPLSTLLPPAHDSVSATTPVRASRHAAENVGGFRLGAPRKIRREWIMRWGDEGNPEAPPPTRNGDDVEGWWNWPETTARAQLAERPLVTRGVLLLDGPSRVSGAVAWARAAPPGVTKPGPSSTRHVGKQGWGGVAHRRPRYPVLRLPRGAGTWAHRSSITPCGSPLGVDVFPTISAGAQPCGAAGIFRDQKEF